MHGELINSGDTSNQSYVTGYNYSNWVNKIHIGF